MALHYCQRRRVIPSLQDPALLTSTKRSTVQYDGREIDCTCCTDVARTNALLMKYRLNADGIDGSDTLGTLVLGFFECVHDSDGAGERSVWCNVVRNTKL